MKAAECLREGKAKWHQTHGTFFHGPDEACSLGVMVDTALGLGMMPTKNSEEGGGIDWEKIEKVLPCIFREDFGPMPCGCSLTFMPSHGLYGSPIYQKLGHAIAHLNDEHRWSFDAIEKWLEGIVFTCKV